VKRLGDDLVDSVSTQALPDRGVTTHGDGPAPHTVDVGLGPTTVGDVGHVGLGLRYEKKKTI
jgi:hypothetical protein